MAYYFSPIGNSQQLATSGAPLSAGTITTFQAGTSTPQATYTDNAGSSPSVSLTLNTYGLPSSPVWLLGGQAYKFVIKDSLGNTIRTLDNVSGINDPTGVPAVDQWVAFSGTLTYISATSFSVAANQTATLQINRRLKTTNTGGTVYSTITNSVFAAGITTVTVANDSGNLDAGLSAVYYGVISYLNTSAPKKTGELIGMQVFTNSGTYTPTQGTASVIVEVQAPGGGSGGAAAVVAGNFSAGAAGGGGGYGSKRITSAFSGVAVTIGAVGAAGVAGNNAGGTGGTTSFGALISCTGGAGGGGGASLAAPGVASGGTGSGATGGTATGADFSRPGGSGQVSFSVSASNGIRGAGGESYYGAGGAEGTVITSVTGGAVGSGYGGGAAGPMNINATLSAVAGSAGAPGLVVVWEYA